MCQHWSLLCYLELLTIYEYAVFEQLSEYMERNCLFYCDQYGFRQGHPTELASVRFVNDLIQQMDNFKIPTSILIDLSIGVRYFGSRYITF